MNAETLRQLLDYNPATGVFTWKSREETDQHVKTWNSKYAGKIAGRTKPNGKGYLEIGVEGKLYFSHRLAWLYMTGEWPEVNIDHKDTDKTNNRWGNLREATVAQNAWNVDYEPGKLGRGVNHHPACKSRPYSGQIQVGGKRISLGYFSTAEEAERAYLAAAEKYHGEFARAA